MLASKGAYDLLEEAWNAHPHYCKTVITNPGYMKEKFQLKIETICKNDDRGDTHNAHELNPEQLQKREIVKVCTANSYFFYIYTVKLEMGLMGLDKG